MQSLLPADVLVHRNSAGELLREEILGLVCCLFYDRLPVERLVLFVAQVVTERVSEDAAETRCAPGQFTGLRAAHIRDAGMLQKERFEEGRSFLRAFTHFRFDRARLGLIFWSPEGTARVGDEHDVPRLFCLQQVT